jgi:hypothetical protein
VLLEVHGEIGALVAVEPLVQPMVVQAEQAQTVHSGAVTAVVGVAPKLLEQEGLVVRVECLEVLEVVVLVGHQRVVLQGEGAVVKSEYIHGRR